MTNTAQEFKVGDKFVVTKESFRQQGYTHVYVVTDVTPHGSIHFTDHNGHESLVFKPEIEKYIETEKHIHHDLIVAWAKDPKGCVIQVKDSFNKWNDTLENNPAWITFCKYRIKPRTKEVQRWKWVVKTIDGAKYFVTDAEYTEDEAKATFKHFTGIKIPDTAVTTIEEI